MTQFFQLDFRSNDVGGAVMPARLMLTKPSMDDLRACRTIVFLVHGFNVSRSAGIAELQRLSQLLPSIGDGAAVAVLWPGDSIVGPTSYPFESNNADDTSVELARFIGDNLATCEGISFVAHSLGARVVLQTVKQLYMKSIPVRQVCLMAGAVDNDSLANLGEYRAAALYAERIAVLYSPADTVLRAAYPAGELLSAFLHWTRTTDAALGYTGPTPSTGSSGALPSEVLATGIAKSFGVNHGDYLPGTGPAPSALQLAAARYADAVLSGDNHPRYP